MPFGTVTLDNGGSITGATGSLTSTGSFELKSGLGQRRSRGFWYSFE
jgi:hypothetical protein